MTKWLILCLFVFTAKVADAQIKIPDGIIDFPVVFNWDAAEEREKQMKVKKLNLYADSLNSYEQWVLPGFLFDPCFDWKGVFWEGLLSGFATVDDIVESRQQKGVKGDIRYERQALEACLQFKNDKRVSLSHGAYD